MKSLICESDDWSSDMWLHELLYGAEKCALKQPDKLAASFAEINKGLLGGSIEVTPLDEHAIPLNGKIIRCNLSRAVIMIKTDENTTEEIRFGALSQQTELGERALHYVPLISMKTDRPYKF